MKPTRPAVALAATLLATSLAACHSAPATIVEGRKYPQNVHYVHSIDIQVFRRNTEVEFTNTTARVFGPSTLWLNGRFSHPIDGLALGQTMRLPLKSFKDEFGDSFRGGGFFATRKSEYLGLAELEVGEDMIGLIVVGNEEP